MASAAACCSLADVQMGRCCVLEVRKQRTACIVTLEKAILSSVDRRWMVPTQG